MACDGEIQQTLAVMSRPKTGSNRSSTEEPLQRLAYEVAEACGFGFVPPVRVRRGDGGEWHRLLRVIQIGIDELASPPDQLWHLVAHELAHGQERYPERHSAVFWRRLAEGLKRAGRLELLHYEIGYREGALRVAWEYGVADLPPISEFLFEIGDAVEDEESRRWIVSRRFRRGGRPYYQLDCPGWRGTASEGTLRRSVRRDVVQVGQDRDVVPMSRGP